MRLKIWTAASAAQIAPVFGTGLKQLAPHTPEHQFIAFSPNDGVPVPEADEVVLVCGVKCLEALQKAGYAPKGRKVQSLREKRLQPENCEGSYFVTYDPNVVNSEPDKLDLIHWDLQLISRFIRTGQLKPVLGDYKWVPDYTDLIRRVEAKFEETGKPVDVSFDTETMGLVPWLDHKDFVAIGFTDRPGFGECLYLGPNFDPCPINVDGGDGRTLFEQLEWLLTTPKIKLRAANGKYDMLWVWVKWKLKCTNFKFDTMLTGSLVNENRSNSLNIHAKTMTDIGGYDDELNAKYDKDKMELIPPDDLLDYLGGDLDACYQSADKIREELLEDPDLANFYVTILHPAARAFENIERRGALVDVDRYHQLRDDLTKEIDARTEAALEILPNRLKIKYRDKIEGQMAEDKFPLTPKILKDFFFSPQGLNLKPQMVTPKTGEPTMARAHLKMFNHIPEAAVMVEALEKVGSATKTRSTFVDGFLAHLRPDGRLHPSYMLFHGAFNDSNKEADESGSVTGRLSAKDPAYQTIPKKTEWAKRIRQCFIAPPGKKVVQIDYSQGELRVVACIANEQNMLNAYENKLDLHAVTGAKLGGVELDEFLSWKKSQDEKKQAMFDDLRTKAKPANFGLLYGMGVNGFQAYAWAQYNLALSLEEATQMRAAFFELYPGLTNYHDNMRQFAKFHEHVRSPLGRVRHLPTIKAWDSEIRSRAERQAINSPVQSTLTDMMLWSISIMDAEFNDDQVAIFGMTHDAFQAYIDEDKLDVFIPQCQEIMTTLPFDKVGWKPQLVFPADAEAGESMGHLKEWSLAA